MSNNDDEKPDMKKKLTSILRQNGFTEYEIRRRSEATSFLYASMYASSKHYWLMKQLPYLLKPDTMTEEDWIDYIEFSWKWFSLINEDIN